MKEGHPTKVKDDLRYYLDSSGRFTTRLREHFEPFTSSDRRVFLKVGSSWIAVDYDLVKKGNVLRVLRPDGAFETWPDGKADLIAMDDARKNADGTWGLRIRKPTVGELEDA